MQRSRVSSSKQSAPQTYWDKYGNFSQTFTEVPFESESFSQTTYNSPRVNGKLVLQPQVYQSYHETITYGLVSETRASNISGTTGTSVIQQIYRPPRYIYPEPPQDDAIRAFYQEASAFKTNVAEMIATRQQTIDMVTDAAKKVADLMRSLKRSLADEAKGKRKRKSKAKDDSISARWLELQYGWLPLIQGVYVSVDDPLPPLSRVIVSRKTRRSQWVVKGNNASSFNVSFTGYLRSTVTVSARVTASNTLLAAAHEYGLNNPALLAWELLPYSFVVDWFFQVGAYLEAMTALSGLTVSEASTTTSYNADMNQLWVSNIQGNPGLTYTSSAGTNVVSIKEKSRVKGLPPYPTLPKFKSPLSLNHLANALALLEQTFGRRR